MCTLCLSDMGELRDEWLREPLPSGPAAVITRDPEPPAFTVRTATALMPDDQAVAA